MTGVPISELPAAPSAQPTDIFPEVQSGTTYKETLTQVFTLFQSQGMIVTPTPPDNGVLISSNTGVPTWLANSGTAGYVLTSNSGAPPSWEASGTGGDTVTQLNADTGDAVPTLGIITISGGTTGLTTIAAADNLQLEGILKLFNGGTNASLSASNGGIVYSNATQMQILLGTSTAKLPLLSGSNSAPSWSAFPLAPVARYVVSTVPGATEFDSINAAISQAISDGAASTNPVTVWIWPGSYPENVNLTPYVHLAAANVGTNATVYVTGNAVFVGPGDLSIDNISFISPNGSSAVSIQSSSTSIISLNSVYLDSGYSGGNALGSTKSSATINLTSCYVNSQSGGQCFNISEGTVNVFNSTTNSVDTQSAISGGTLTYSSSYINDCILVSGSATVSAYNSSISALDFSVAVFSDTSNGLFINCSIDCGSVDNYMFNGTANLFEYENLSAVGPATLISPTLNAIGLASYVGNLSFDGGATTLNADGQVWIGNTSTGIPVANTLTAGTNISIANGPNSITISSTGSSGIPWSDQSSSFSCAINNGYIATAALTATLPTGTSVGQTNSFIADSTGTLVIQAASGQFIRIGTSISAAGGTATNSAHGDTLNLVYSDTTSTWIDNSGVGGSWNVV